MYFKLHNPTLLNALNPIGHPLALMSFIALQRLCYGYQYNLNMG